MESHGTADRIQITRATYELIKDEFVCEYRGPVPVKGKGDMETWYLVGRRSAGSAASVPRDGKLDEARVPESVGGQLPPRVV
jgi:class 3 adenylate cyclase